MKIIIPATPYVLLGSVTALLIAAPILVPVFFFGFVVACIVGYFVCLVLVTIVSEVYNHYRYKNRKPVRRHLVKT